ncbi:hypothetical protein Celaphus_00000757 [Cervus elaphus hippelaphus]|uniref:60S ribosomal protein L10-like n=1 Tax=Cervus elaphus hippelaphus TaxID=46360 RepID=A0A212DA38_CEREH|nr:hypothetical protein Celaphus_00000757 [Cervus elaphus hippelaphus]
MPQDRSCSEELSSQAPDRCTWHLFKAPGQSSQGPHWPIIMFIRTKVQNKEHVMKALCRAKFKFHGCQKIHISKKWGFFKFNVDEFENTVAEKWLIRNGCGELCVQLPIGAPLHQDVTQITLNPGTAEP